MSSSLNNESAPLRDAAFLFKGYKFVRSVIDYSSLSDDRDLKIEFIPAGKYFAESGIYETELVFIARDQTTGNEIINIKCEALFEFREPISLEELPDYFFTNSTAIIYPYIRAFVSTLTLQSNHKSFLLPTYNVSSLGKKLKQETKLG